MTDKPRFTIELRIHDRLGDLRPIGYAVGCDNALRISSRAVNMLKFPGPIPEVTFDDAIEMIRTKEVRRGILIQAAEQLAGQLCNLLEDAEGWHDPSRIENARKAIGGTWT